MYRIGDILESNITHQDCLSIAVQDDLITMFIHYQNVSMREISNFITREIELHLLKYKDIIVFSYTLDKRNYLESCYNPNLSPVIKADRLRKSGYDLIMLLIDADSGQILRIRYQRLPVEFSRKLSELIMSEQVTREQFDEDKYYANVEEMWNTYTSRQIFNFGKNIECVIKEFNTPQQIVFANDLPL